MTLFRIKLQIPGILLPQNKQSKKMLGYSDTMSSMEPRYFWAWCRRKKDEPKADGPRTQCGKEVPVRPRLCNPQCGSRCLQVKGCDKETVEQRLSNCEKPGKPKRKSCWEWIFGWTIEEPPDPCTCRRIHREKQIAREKDPRLCDSRYEATPGDVFIFTELPRSVNCKSQEAQPKPPPPFKLPNAVLTKNIREQAEKMSIPCSAALQFIASCTSPKCSGPKPYKLPYEEMRPLRRQTKAFSCKLGIQPQDVAPPIRKRSATCLSSKSACSFDPINYRDKPAESVTDWKPINPKSTRFSRGSRRYSRIEQLKRQTDQKEGNDFSEILGSGPKKITESQSTSCPSSCK